MVNAVAMLVGTCVCVLLLHCATQAEQALEWHDAAALTIEGKAWPDTQSPFDRLPARALDKVTNNVKGLSRQSAGMAIRFRTDSGTLRVRWSLGDGNYTMTHMAATGTSGLDLYVKLPDGRWTFAGVGRHEEKQDNVRMLSGRGTPAWAPNQWHHLVSSTAATARAQKTGRGRVIEAYDGAEEVTKARLHAPGAEPK